jgi:hypothetical protein
MAHIAASGNVGGLSDAPAPGDAAMIRHFAALLVTLALSACATPPPGAGRFGAEVDLPPGCRMAPVADIPGRHACTYQPAPGITRSIFLATGALEIGASDRAAFAADPWSAGVALLRQIERRAVAAPGFGVERVLRSTARPVPADRTAPGADACLRFEFDTLSRMPDGRPLRNDNVGIRCGRYDPARNVFAHVMLEVIDGRAGSTSRSPGIDAAAAPVVGSLRLE